ncbi:hypothetical protein E6P09_13500 [Haloferax mediterranei ATCC 33500]|uniref:Uncharacterized protein n=1 Tax=Haloferax mediterranei (strain ATCC 33500 / DSM 1411 / JCM 8866 / NBRC 14739 / NCIMB 2177 / R-4) TaxID=523841 RepID=I3R7X1_HALMT|nr:hypothetical protein [Haloferax mediterranei]AFK20331.1 hypothetical protein HFX_2653 [Haloferax mediterranei ATCC 33500]MDX5986912.1 hypothetical protein [Haloferax mediterranei ATCC 33500]QCQ76234.1 hypothetical protein E6P09_13500 [Haloferax mediterranei ATCC 33500]
MAYIKSFPEEETKEAADRLMTLAKRDLVLDKQSNSNPWSTESVDIGPNPIPDPLDDAPIANELENSISIEEIAKSLSGKKNLY